MLLFIVFGTRGVKSTIQEGKFHCPQCEQLHPYRHRKVTKFFTLYFIPLIPLGSAGEYVECGVCNGTFVPRILDYSNTIEVEAREVEQRPRNTVNGGAVTALNESTSSREKAAPAPVNNDEFMTNYEKAIKHSMVLIMLADGVIDDAEKEMVLKIINKFKYNDLNMDDLDQYIKQVQSENEDVSTYLKKVAATLNLHGKQTVIRAAYSVAESDGHVDRSELEVIREMGIAMEMTSSQMRELFTELRK